MSPLANENGVPARLQAWLSTVEYGKSGAALRESIGKFVVSEREQHAEEFDQFIESMVVSWLTHKASSLLSRARHQSRRSVFQNLAEDVERSGGSPAEAAAAVTGLLADAMVVAEGNVRKRVADMTGQDHLYVAGHYDHVGRQARLLAQFHVAVARKVEGCRTGDVFTDEAYASLYRSIVGRDHPHIKAA